MRIIDYPSPNYDERKHILDMLIIHYTAMVSAHESLKRLCDPEAEVSCHYLVDENGDVYKLMSEEKRAKHAGISYWHDRERISNYSIGIELQNLGDRIFSNPQMQALIHLIQDIRTRWAIPDHHILGHSDIAPDRKIDPGHLFDWGLLASHGHGIWPTRENIETYRPILDIRKIQQYLQNIGYRCPVTSEMDAYTVQVIEAFQRHFCPLELDKGLTAHTTQMIQAVAYLIPA